MMRFLTANHLQTTTMLSVTSATLSSYNLLNLDPTYQYVSSGFNNDSTWSSIVIDFGETLNVSHIGLVNMNYQRFSIYHSGATANALTLLNGPTSSSTWSTNSETSMMLSFSTIQARTITIEARDTIVSASEKAIGYIYLGDLKLDVAAEKIPSSSGYKPLYKPKESVQTMSDGGTRINYLAQKFECKISLDYVVEDFRNSLYDLWQEKSEMFFVPFGTATGWDKILHSVVWVGNFTFFEYSDNAISSGFTGSINLRETS